MALTPSEKAAALLLLVDPSTRKKILQSFKEEDRIQIETSLVRIQQLPPDELRRVVGDVCEDPLLKVPVAERELEEWFSARQKREKRSLLDPATVTRFLRKLDPRVLFYRRSDEKNTS